jgi:hypothetical protein
MLIQPVEERNCTDPPRRGHSPALPCRQGKSVGLFKEVRVPKRRPSYLRFCLDSCSLLYSATEIHLVYGSMDDNSSLHLASGYSTCSYAGVSGDPASLFWASRLDFEVCAGFSPRSVVQIIHSARLQLKISRLRTGRWLVAFLSLGSVLWLSLTFTLPYVRCSY